MNWIKCEDKLPDIDTPVLIMFNGEVRIGEVCQENSSYEEGYDAFLYWDCPYNDGQDWEVFDITHWMPLPPPAKDN